jgi:chromosome segregation ATPase
VTTLDAILSAMVALGALPWVPAAVRRITALVTKRGRDHIAAEEREHSARIAELDRAIARADKAEAQREAERDEHEEAMAAERARCDHEKDMLRTQVAALHAQLGEAALELQRSAMTASEVLRMRDEARDQLAAGAKDMDVARRTLAALLKT